ncbi:hypothetical protein HZA97_00590 [Candidatus Woesearchaeota archaeon]|nr:hypothetical protein [Candidatus Woesearchaeota archaeon]
MSDINELVDEAVEIASQDFASVKVEKGEEAIKQEFLYLVKKIFSEKEFKLNPDGYATEGLRVYENGGNAFYQSYGALLLTFFAHYENRAGSNYTNIQFSPLKVRSMMSGFDVDATQYYPLKIEVFSRKVFDKAKIFAKAYEHISGQKATIVKQFHEEENNPELEKIISSYDERVKVNEPSHFRIARWIKEAGYEIANLDGYSTNEPTEKGIGILKSKGRNFLGFSKGAYYVGTISFTNTDFWFVRVHGKEFLNEVTNLVTNLSGREKIPQIHVELESENTKNESVHFDY